MVPDGAGEAEQEIFGIAIRGPEMRRQRGIARSGIAGGGSSCCETANGEPGKTCRQQREEGRPNREDDKRTVHDASGHTAPATHHLLARSWPGGPEGHLAENRE